MPQSYHSTNVSVDSRQLRSEGATDHPLSNGSFLRGDGWVTKGDGSLLFRVPPEYQSRLPWPRILPIIGAQPIQIIFDRFFRGATLTLIDYVTLVYCGSSGRDCFLTDLCAV